MLPERYRWITAQFEPDGDAWLLLDIAGILEQEDNLEGAASVYDRAFGLEPDAEPIREGRQRVLDQLAVVEHGLIFRYIPGGPFLMGSNDGEDERPVHPVWLSPFWMADTPISWEAYCRLMDWPDRGPREPFPDDDEARTPWYRLFGEDKIRGYYCHEQAPMVAVSWQSGQELANRLSGPLVRYALPTEAQWEKAARGGLIGARHAWGDAAPSPERCDFNRLSQSPQILPLRSLPANGYGLYAMNGGVWEWTCDWYDRDYYGCSPDTDPQGPVQGKEKVLRGGSWTDCADVVTVTFRMSRTSGYWREASYWRDEYGQLNPNVGFRLCRMVVGNQG